MVRYWSYRGVDHGYSTGGQPGAGLFRAQISQAGGSYMHMHMYMYETGFTSFTAQNGHTCSVGSGSSNLYK